jgi:hypothetical protein
MDREKKFSFLLSGIIMSSRHNAKQALAFKPIQYGEYPSPNEPASTGASLARAHEKRQALSKKSA